ncbi:hypothetical protein [Vibrio phage vB_VmeM-Yong XC32]|nr:hypothetical protein [Vibrio phage vB_VmeM-Yong XC31]QAX96614.1 hypothetical protein [Vibrio phage vB_VmeM-Yong XC32]QAX96932.1 hypothetical protein [Vibrio phage vB_VmeM-Yong MS31]QAX97237.1 hypothetical protein [Vibrio phage vB_VmeM-Yong MS32]
MKTSNSYITTDSLKLGTKDGDVYAALDLVVFPGNCNRVAEKLLVKVVTHKNVSAIYDAKTRKALTMSLTSKGVRGARDLAHSIYELVTSSARELQLV